MSQMVGQQHLLAPVVRTSFHISCPINSPFLLAIPLVPVSPRPSKIHHCSPGKSLEYCRPCFARPPSASSAIPRVKNEPHDWPRRPSFRRSDGCVHLPRLSPLSETACRHRIS